LYQGDCRDILPRLEPVAAILTDPPFGVRDDEWDSMDDHQFAQFSMAWLCHARRLADRMVSFCFGGGDYQHLCEMLYPRVRPMIWHKPLGSQYAGSSEHRLWFSYETILYCLTAEACKPKTRVVADAIRAARKDAGLSCGAVDMAVRGKKTGLCYRWEESACLPTAEQVETLRSLLVLPDGFDAMLSNALSDKAEPADKADVFLHPTVSTHGHPCEKPVRLLEDLLVSILKDCGSILDPFMGVGSSGVAAVSQGRAFVGIEQDRKYFDIACERISAAQSQQRLFA
jgi:hypothetical protein